MKPWLKRRAKTRKNGRTVVVTSVVFDTQVFETLCNYVDLDKAQRSEIVNKAVRDALATPGWLESAFAGSSEPYPITFECTPKPPSSNSRIHARGGVEGPATRRSSASRPPSKPAASSKRGNHTSR